MPDERVGRWERDRGRKGWAAARRKASDGSMSFYGRTDRVDAPPGEKLAHIGAALRARSEGPVPKNSRRKTPDGVCLLLVSGGFGQKRGLHDSLTCNRQTPSERPRVRRCSDSEVGRARRPRPTFRPTCRYLRFDRQILRTTGPTHRRSGMHRGRRSRRRTPAMPSAPRPAQSA